MFSQPVIGDSLIILIMKIVSMTPFAPSLYPPLINPHTNIEYAGPAQKITDMIKKFSGSTLVRVEKCQSVRPRIPENAHSRAGFRSFWAYLGVFEPGFGSFWAYLGGPGPGFEPILGDLGLDHQFALNYQAINPFMPGGTKMYRQRVKKKTSPILTIYFFHLVLRWVYVQKKL